MHMVDIHRDVEIDYDADWFYGSAATNHGPARTPAARAPDSSPVQVEFQHFAASGDIELDRHS